MPLTHLPFELQLLILDYIKINNHLDLAPISQTCKHFASLVRDRFYWTQTVTIIEPPKSQFVPFDCLRWALKNGCNTKNLNTNKLQANVNHNVPSIKTILTIIENQQRDDILQSIHVVMPNLHQHRLYKTLTDNPQTNLHELSIRDLTDDGYIMASELISKFHMIGLLEQFISKTLVESQNTLTRLDLPAFPCSLLIAHKTQYIQDGRVKFRSLQFPQVRYLHVALIGHGQDYNYVWRKVKAMFPALIELRLTLDKNYLASFRSLLQDNSLFPWIKRLTVQSRDCPKSYLAREELRNSLLQLNGLNRITAGWDMIALN